MGWQCDGCGYGYRDTEKEHTGIHGWRHGEEGKLQITVPREWWEDQCGGGARDQGCARRCARWCRSSVRYFFGRQGECRQTHGTCESENRGYEKAVPRDRQSDGEIRRWIVRRQVAGRGC